METWTKDEERRYFMVLDKRERDAHRRHLRRYWAMIALGLGMLVTAVLLWSHPLP